MNILILSPDEIIAKISAMTQRQTQVAESLAAGLTDRQISKQIGIARRTVRKHIWGACDRARVDNRTQLVALIVARKYIENLEA